MYMDIFRLVLQHLSLKQWFTGHSTTALVVFLVAIQDGLMLTPLLGHSHVGCWQDPKGAGTFLYRAQ